MPGPLVALGAAGGSRAATPLLMIGRYDVCAFVLMMPAVAVELAVGVVVASAKGVITTTAASFGA